MVLNDKSRDQPTGSEFYSVAEIARMLDVSQHTVRGIIKRGILPGLKIGNSYRVKKQDLHDFVGQAK